MAERPDEEDSHRGSMLLRIGKFPEREQKPEEHEAHDKLRTVEEHNVISSASSSLVESQTCGDRQTTLHCKNIMKRFKDDRQHFKEVEFKLWSERPGNGSRWVWEENAQSTDPNDGSQWLWENVVSDPARTLQMLTEATDTKEQEWKKADEECNTMWKARGKLTRDSEEWKKLSDEHREKSKERAQLRTKLSQLGCLACKLEAERGEEERLARPCSGWSSPIIEQGEANCDDIGHHRAFIRAEAKIAFNWLCGATKVEEKEGKEVQVMQDGCCRWQQELEKGHDLVACTPSEAAPSSPGTVGQIKSDAQAAAAFASLVLVAAFAL